MSIATGIWRSGRIDLLSPPPSEWSDGDELSVLHSGHRLGIDIRDDSPEAVAAWVAWYDALDASIGKTSFPEELERLLSEEKAAELAAWEVNGHRIETVFP